MPWLTILNSPQPSPTVKKRLEFRLNAGPDFDTCSITSIRHGDVVNVDIFHDVRLSLVLAERTHTNSVGS